MQANAMSNVEFTTIAWGETLFKNTFETAWQIVQAVVSHQKPLALFRKIAALSRHFASWSMTVRRNWN
jgi:hypothetical protein